MKEEKKAGQGTPRYLAGICTVRMAPYDGSAQSREVLCRVLRAWFGGKRRQSGREKRAENGKEISCSYRLTKSDFRWEKRCGSLMLEESAAEDYGWSILTRDFTGTIVSKTRYSFAYEWLQTAYFEGGHTARAAACLRRSANGLELLRWDAEAGRYRSQELVPCELPEEGGLASLVDSEAGAPTVTAELVYGGRTGFCPREQAARRAEVLRRESGRPFAVRLPEEEGGDRALDAFHVIDNTRRAKPHAAEKPSAPVHLEEEPAQAAPEAPQPAPASEPAPAPAVQPAPEHPAAAEPIRAAEPAAPQGDEPQDAPDYALNREVSFFPEDWVIETAPRQVERILINDAANNRAMNALLEEVAAARGRNGRPARYTVAAKGRGGALRTPLPKEEPEFVPAEQEPILLPSLKAVKQIVVSAEESYLYFGELENGKRTGRGRTQMQNGFTAYEGGYRDDRRDGFGVYYYKSGRLCYAGQWKQNRREGAGVSFSSRDGSLFAGKWKDNVPTGLGAAFDPEGNLIYTGEWKDGKRHGHGTEYRDGKVLFTGEWENGRPVKGFRRID